MCGEVYKVFIDRMLTEITGERHLKIIYTIVHRFYINEGREEK